MKNNSFIVFNYDEFFHFISERGGVSIKIQEEIKTQGRLEEIIAGHNLRIFGEMEDTQISAFIFNYACTVCMIENYDLINTECIVLTSGGAYLISVSEGII